MNLNPAYLFIHDQAKGVVLLHEKKHTIWNYAREWPTDFTCAVTGLKYYALAGPCYTCAERPGVIISAEGVYKLREKAFSFLR